MSVIGRPIDLTSGRVALSLAEYLAMPGDTRAEIVDGVLRPMLREDHRHRTTQWVLANVLSAQVPQGRVRAHRGVQFDPDITVTVHRLVGDRYEVAGAFGRGETVLDAALPWAAVEVTPLLDRYV